MVDALGSGEERNRRGDAGFLHRVPEGLGGDGHNSTGKTGRGRDWLDRNIILEAQFREAGKPVGGAD
jgi:hypothetical protein